jgi:FecR protein
MKRFGEAEDPRRRVLVQALTSWIAAMGIPGGAAMAASIFGTPPAKLPPGQSIYRISGSATVNGNNATLATPIRGGDVVRTGKDSEMVFVVGGTSMFLRADSNVELEAAQGDNLLLRGLRLLTGKILSVHGRGNPFRIQTPIATIGIRGTGVYLEADPEQSYVCTCYGVTDISANNDPESKETVEATHHDKPLYVAAKARAGNSIRRAPFINHTDQELMLIETLVGRTPPFVFPGSQYNAPRRDY